MKPAGKIFVNHGIQCVDLKPRIAYQLKCILPIINAAVNGHLELPLLKGRQRLDAISASNLEVYKFRDW